MSLVLLNNKNNIPEPAYSHLFGISIPDGKGGGSNTALLASGGSFPFSAWETYPYHKENSYVYFPDNYDISDIEIEFYEFYDSRFLKYFLDWRSKLFSSRNNGTYALPGKGQPEDFAKQTGDTIVGFKRPISISRLNLYSEDSDIQVGFEMGYEAMVINYVGCFPKSISEFTPSAESPNILKFTVSFSCDDIKVEFKDTPKYPIADLKQLNAVKQAKGKDFTLKSEINEEGTLFDTSKYTELAQKLTSRKTLKGLNTDEEIAVRRALGQTLVSGARNTGMGIGIGLTGLAQSELGL